MSHIWSIQQCRFCKVASFAIDEEELRGPQQAPPTPTTPSHSTKALSTSVSRYRTDKSWEELIPTSELSRMKAEEDQEEQLRLYLPPRQRNVKVCLGGREGVWLGA